MRWYRGVGDPGFHLCGDWCPLVRLTGNMWLAESDACLGGKDFHWQRPQAHWNGVVDDELPISDQKGLRGGVHALGGCGDVKTLDERLIALHALVVLSDSRCTQQGFQELGPRNEQGLSCQRISVAGEQFALKDAIFVQPAMQLCLHPCSQTLLKQCTFDKHGLVE
jgi:hypothetical protein